MLSTSTSSIDFFLFLLSDLVVGWPALVGEAPAHQLIERLNKWVVTTLHIFTIYSASEYNVPTFLHAKPRILRFSRELADKRHTLPAIFPARICSSSTKPVEAAVGLINAYM